MSEEVSDNLRRPRPISHEASLFVALGLVSYGLGAGIAALSKEVLGVRADIAVALSLLILIVVNFWLNRIFIFRGSGRWLPEFGRFVVTSGAMRGFEFVLFLALLRVVHLHYLVAFTTALVISNCGKFLLYRSVVFRRPTAPR